MTSRLRASIAALSAATPKTNRYTRAWHRPSAPSFAIRRSKRRACRRSRSKPSNRCWAGLLLDNSAWDRISDILGEADFYRADHRTIFHHIAQLIEENKPADALTVAESLELTGKLADVGGQAYIGSLALNTPSAANIRRYAEIVRERSIMRSLAAIGTQIADSAYTPLGKDASVLIDEAEAKIFQIAEAGAKARQGFVKIDPLLTETVERIDMLYSRDNKNDVIGVPTGFVDLDRITSGLQPGELIIVAGRPSMGKTTLVMNMAEHVALSEKKAVGVFSMEMSGPQLAMRMIGSVGRVDQHELRTGTFKEDDWSRLVDAVGKLNEAQIYIDDTAGLNVLELRSRARRLHRQCGGLSMIVVDYLQLMSGTGGGREENRATEIAGDLALAEKPREGAQGPGRRALAVESQRRFAPGQAADDVGPAGIGRDRAGCGRDRVHLPRRSLQPRLAEKGYRRNHRREAAQRPRRQSRSHVPRQVHALRELRGRRPLLCRPQRSFADARPP